MCGFRLFVFAGYFGICKGITLGICVLADEGTNSPLKFDADVYISIKYLVSKILIFVCFHGALYDAIRYSDIVLFGGPIPDVELMGVCLSVFPFK